MQRITITAGIGEGADGKPMTHDEVERGLDRVRLYLASQAGGYTEVPSQGGWIDQTGRLVQETGRRFVVLAESDRDASHLANFVGIALHQNSVALEVERVQEARIVETARMAASVSQ